MRKSSTNVDKRRVREVSECQQNRKMIRKTTVNRVVQGEASNLSSSLIGTGLSAILMEIDQQHEHADPAVIEEEQMIAKEWR
nr:hypothetical protein CFP56_03950 [Quercus suber]